MTKQSPNTHNSETVPKPSLNWQTILFNCDCHEFEAVVRQLVQAIGCSEITASQLAYIAHQFGCASVFKGTREKCEQVANVLGSIGLVVKVVQ